MARQEVPSGWFSYTINMTVRQTKRMHTVTILFKLGFVSEGEKERDIAFLSRELNCITRVDSVGPKSAPTCCPLVTGAVQLNRVGTLFNGDG